MDIPNEGPPGFERGKVICAAMVFLTFAAMYLNLWFLEGALDTLEPKVDRGGPWSFDFAYRGFDSHMSARLYIFHFAIVFGGMALTAFAVVRSTWTALGIGYITAGCALLMPMLHPQVTWDEVMPLMATGPLLVLVLCIAAVLLDRPDDQARECHLMARSPITWVAVIAVALGVLVNWFLAALLVQPAYLAGAAAALIVVRRSRDGWLGLVGAGVVALAGIASVAGNAPSPGIVEPLAWFGILAGILVAAYLAIGFAICQAIADPGTANPSPPETRPSESQSP